MRVLMRRMGLVLVLLSSAAAFAGAQQPRLIPDRDSASVARPPRVRTFRIQSTTLGQARRIDVVLPASFDRTGSNRHYPVVVAFDAEANMVSLAQVSDQLARNGQIPEMIYVGIENAGGDRQRVFDLTPPGMSVSGSDTRQGGDKLLDFIETELLPAVDRQFRGGKPRLMIGHSSGGILAIYAAATRPEFRGVVAIDAPATLQREWLVDRLVERAKKPDGVPLRLAVYQAQFPFPDAAWKRVTDVAPKGWLLHRESLSLEGHETVYFLAAYLGLREIFSDYSRLAAQNKPPTQVLAYYDSIAGRFGAPLLPPQRVLRDLVDDLASAGRGRTAREALSMLVAGYGTPTDAAELSAAVADAEKLAAPKESVQELLATPFPPAAAVTKYVGEWQGDLLFALGQPRRGNVRFRIRIDAGKVFAETRNIDAPPDMAGWRPVDYLRVTANGLTWGRLNGMRPRGVMLWEGVLQGDTLSGKGRWGGVSVSQPEQPEFVFVRVRP